MTTLNDFFDKVYVINLDADTERLATATSELGRVEVAFERIAAMSGEDVPEENKIPEEEQIHGWNDNAVALTLKTIEILEDAKANGYEKIFIFEDDVRCTTNFQGLFGALVDNLPEEWDFIHLNANNIEKPEHIAPCVVKLKRAICCQAYGIHQDVYDVYLEKLRGMTKPIDEHTADIHGEREKSYGCSVNAVYHVGYQYSSLRNQIVNY